jgi:Fe-S cluster assembly ATP-binding protein
VPDSVHVLYRGQVIKSGDKSLAIELEENGYAGFIDEAA